jgi:hypothetical protein
MSSSPGATQSYFDQMSNSEFDDQNISAEMYLEIPGDVRLVPHDPAFI